MLEAKMQKGNIDAHSSIYCLRSRSQKEPHLLMESELVGAESFRRSESCKEPYHIEGAGARRSRIIWGSLSYNMMWLRLYQKLQTLEL
jgi:hypothetical protein